jgi:sulfate transport system substrate-binding protein
VAAKYATVFPKVTMLTVRDFGGWEAVRKKHFEEGATFDQIFKR